MTEKVQSKPPRAATVTALLSTLRQSKEALVGTAILLALLIVAVVPWLFTQYNPYAVQISVAQQAPSWVHLMGTDYLGRDILSRVIYGAQVDMEVAVAVFLIATTFGTAIGVIAGYGGGMLDEGLMRITDVFLSFPFLILALVIAALLGHGVDNVIVALSIVFWTPYARLARAQTLQIKRELYVESAVAVGASDFRIVTKHILPMIVPAVIVQAALQSSQVILSIASLGFLGLGPQPPSSEWGLMIYGGLDYINTAWWVSVFPGLAIIITCFAFNLIGDSARDFIDIRSIVRR